MILSLDESRIISLESFKGKVWISLRHRGAGITFELTPQIARQIGCEMFNQGRKIDKASD